MNEVYRLQLYVNYELFFRIVIFLLVFVTVGTCVCFPRLSSWKHDSIQPVEYQIFTAAPSNVPYTRQHKQQPQQYQPYRYRSIYICVLISNQRFKFSILTSWTFIFPIFWRQQFPCLNTPIQTRVLTNHSACVVHVIF